MEYVLAIKRASLEEAGMNFKGFYSHPLRFLSFISQPHVSGFYEREGVERDDSLKQVIPFFVVRRDDEVLINERSCSQGDERLRGKLSLLIGGHVNLEDKPDIEEVDQHYDMSVLNAIITGAKRELHEELLIIGDNQHSRAQVVGMVNEEDTEVGRAHIGIVIHLFLPQSASVHKRCDSLASIRFVRRQDLCGKDPSPGLTSRLETWSQIVASRLDQPLDSILKQPLLSFCI